ncbi:hypothetical protein PYCCODRAFT_687089 [Trametes coccinea BRFM310]|uniref:Uncharacterized protein n=1 Tax=Trametes coccinea (strain BRFM310) TaxID=1353009 RepID=A0A1Y2IH43_TRAC3|nr:hypothetical protein PYCCODRAFT_687089 [Trametes coccinea BRFM310]
MVGSSRVYIGRLHNWRGYHGAAWREVQRPQSIKKSRSPVPSLCQETGVKPNLRCKSGLHCRRAQDSLQSSATSRMCHAQHRSHKLEGARGSDRRCV